MDALYDRNQTVRELFSGATITVLSLFFLTYLYALSGLDGFYLMVVYPVLFILVATTTLFIPYSIPNGKIKSVVISVALIVFGLALAGEMVGKEQLRGPVFVSLLLGTIFLYKFSTEYNQEVSLLTAISGLAVLFGAFPYAGSNLMGTSKFAPISFQFHLNSSAATVFGFQTPAFVFSAPNFTVSINVLQLLVGVIA